MAGNDKPSAPKRGLIIALAAAFALLIIGILLLLLLPENTRQSAGTATVERFGRYEIAAIDSGLSEVRLFPSAGAPYSIKAEYMSDYMTGSYTLIADDALFGGRQVELDNVFRAATSLISQMHITDNASDTQLAGFGFDEPRLKWEVVYTDGSSQHFELGSELLTGDGSYVRVQGSRDIYTFAVTQSSYLLKSLEELYDISFVPVAPTTQDEPTWVYISYVKLEKSDGEVIEIQRRAEEEFEGAATALSTFRMLQPFEADCTDRTVQAVLLEAITHIQPASLVAARPAALSGYGLDSPDILTVKLPLSEDEDYTATLLIGNFDSGPGGRYVMLQGHDAVLLDPGGNYDFLNITAYELRSRHIWLHPISAVSSVEFSLSGATRVLELRHGGDGLSGLLDGAEISAEDARMLYTSALSVMASGGTDAPIPSGVPPAYSITMRFAAGGSETLDLYTLENSQFLIVRDGVSTGSYITRLDLRRNLLDKFD